MSAAESQAEVTRLTEPAEVLLRRAHPTQLRDGEVLRTVFTPTTRDRTANGYELSHLRESVGAAEAFRRQIEDEGRPCGGVWGVSVGEYEQLGMPSFDDSQLPERPADHSFARMDLALSRGELAQLARKVRAQAIARGRLHPQGEPDLSDDPS